MFAVLVATCLSFADYDQILRATGKQQIWRGVNKNQTTMNAIYADEKGAWVVLAVNPEGRACEMGSGEYSEILIQKIGSDINAK